MKKVLIGSLLMVSVLMAQIGTRWLHTNDIFDGKYQTCLDSMGVQYQTVDKWGRTVKFYTLTSDTLQDSIFSKVLSNRYRHADLHLNFGLINDSAEVGAPNAISVDFVMGLFVGYGYGGVGTASVEPDSTGWLEKSLALDIIGDTVISISLADSSWWTDYPVIEYYVKIKEDSAMKNKYFFNIEQFGEQ